MEANGTENTAIIDHNGFVPVPPDQDGNHYNEEGLGTPDFGPLVNRIALGLAKELASAIKELEHQVAVESRRAAEAVERRLDSTVIDVVDLSRFAGEQRSTNSAVHEQLQQLTAESREFSSRLDATAAALQECDARHTREREALQSEVRSSFQPVWERFDNLSRDLGARQEDIDATRNSLNTISSRIDECVQRLDRHADAVRTLHGDSRQRSNEFEQIVEGLIRLKANPQPELAEGL